LKPEATRHRSARGQATTETILLTWLILLFFAATYQVYLVNQSVYRTMTAVHQKLFENAFDGNCYSDNDATCRYNSDKTANIIWRPQEFPEVKIRIVNLFTRWGMPTNLVVESIERPPAPSKGCDVPCKHTKLAVGNYWPILDCLIGFGCLK